MKEFLFLKFDRKLGNVLKSDKIVDLSVCIY